MTNHARNGGVRERRVRDHLIAHGWLLVSKSGGSRGAADLVMVHPDHGLSLVQVGTAASKRLGPADRNRLCDLADLCNALALVATTIPGVGIQYRIADRGPASRWEPFTP